MYTRPDNNKGRTLLVIAVIAQTLGAAAAGADRSYGFGEDATPEQIAALDLDVRFDGVGLPTGRGDAETGKTIYIAQCASCHGLKLEGNAALYIKPLAGNRRHALNQQPFAPPIFGYIRRSMPLTQPGSLADDEVYALMAYLLRELDIIDGANPSLDANALSSLRMPNRENFVPVDDSGVSLPEIRD